jgi:sarcosine oxidase subunit beta
MSDLPATAAVVIVGGGCIGASIAFHLAEAGVSDVVVVERAAVGSGSTSKAAGGVRATFSDEINVRIGRRGLDAFAAFTDRPGAHIEFQRCGYLYLLDREADVAAFRASVALQRGVGIDVDFVAPERVPELSPLADPEGLLAAVWSPDDGKVTPEGVAQGYAIGARRHGARVIEGCAVSSIDVEGDRVVGVTTDRGSIAAEHVVVAAGAWSAQIAATAGLELPIVPSRRQCAYTGPMADLPRELPLTFDFANSAYLHREGQGIVIGMSLRDEPDGFRLETDDLWLERFLDVAERRFPRLAEAGVASQWAGLYENTPDHNAVIGSSRTTTGLHYAAGFSGHGVMQSPPVGEVVRDLIMGEAPPIDVSPLSAERFAEGRLRAEYNVI